MTAPPRHEGRHARPVAGVRPAEPREAETWRSRARTLVRGVLAMCRYRGDDAAQTRAALRKAYPWPDATKYRRRIWSEEVAIALGKRRRHDPRERQAELDLNPPAPAEAEPAELIMEPRR